MEGTAHVGAQLYRVSVGFTSPFMGMMGVAFTPAASMTAPELNSIPPTLGGGNIDINHLGAGSRFYLPVVADGALFYTGDPTWRWATARWH